MANNPPRIFSSFCSLAYCLSIVTGVKVSTRVDRHVDGWVVGQGAVGRVMADSVHTHWARTRTQRAGCAHAHQARQQGELSGKSSRYISEVSTMHVREPRSQRHKGGANGAQMRPRGCKREWMRFM